tara:strand:+ start:1038 stop:1616 length:579 start_codon:yes stop_codon:yes gene_type:complete
MAQLYDDLIEGIRFAVLGANTHSGGKVVWGLLRFGIFDSPASAATSGIPAYAIDPAIPPVWPVTIPGRFGTDVIYGSERMNTNLNMTRGDDYSFDCIAILDGVVFDLSLYTVKLSCKKNLNDAANFLQITSPSSGISITSAVDGTFTCTIASALTSSLPPYIQRFPYDIEISYGAIKHTLARGYLIIRPDVT